MTVASELAGMGYDSSYGGRAKLYGEKFGGGFKGTAAQNLQLLAALKGGGSKGVPVGTMIIPGQPNNSIDSAYSALSSFYNNLQNPAEQMNQLSSQYGIPDLQNSLKTIAGNIGTQQNLLSNLEPDISKRTAGFDVNEAQRRSILAKESAPLAKTISELTNSQAAAKEDYSNKMNLINTLLGLSEKANANKEAALKTNISAAEAAYNREQARKKTGTSAATKAEAKKASTYNEAYNYAKNQYAVNNSDENQKGGWTESTLQPDLIKKYGKSLSPEELNYILYEARKETWGN